MITLYCYKPFSKRSLDVDSAAMGSYNKQKWEWMKECEKKTALPMKLYLTRLTRNVHRGGNDLKFYSRYVFLHHSQPLSWKLATGEQIKLRISPSLNIVWNTGNNVSP